MHILSPMSAPWCGWTMLVLMLMAVASEWLQPGSITQAYTSVKVHQERTYKDAPTNIMAQTMLTLFRIGTIGMAICLCLPFEGNFSFLAFMAICTLVFVVLLVKMISNVLIDYTFSITRRFGEVYEHYSNLLTLVTVVLYPILLLFMRIDSISVARWLLLTFAGVFLVLWLLRCVQQYIRTFRAFLYVLVYILTLEILPMASLIVISEKTISLI